MTLLHIRRMAFLVLLVPAAWAQTHPHRVADLGENSRQLFADGMRVSDANCDQARHFVAFPGSRGTVRISVRETSWYALGLLLRDGAGDRAKAAAALDAVLGQQYVQPGTRWFGTFKRSPVEAAPPANAKDFDQFDPNWREFIGDAFEIILIEFPDRIPAALAARLYHSIDMALEGEKVEGRLHPNYTNPALMYGALWDFAAQHHHDKAMQAEADAWNDSVYAIFKQHNAFPEYNSPTYYGVDLFGLALWRSYGSTAHLRGMGAEMEAAMWNDVADFYQPSLRNIAGPYDRSYGMAMESYTAVMGLWMRTLLPAAKAPLPPIDASLDHALDDWFIPMVVMVGAKVPAGALGKIEHFPGPHLVERQITDQRSATAWIGEDVLLGAEFTHRTVGVGPKSQFHPATVQWRAPSGEIGWVYVTRSPAIDATASEHGLVMEADGEIGLRIHAPGAKPEDISGTLWNMPGMRLEVATDGGQAVIERHDGWVDMTYPGVHRMTITRKP